LQEEFARGHKLCFLARAMRLPHFFVLCCLVFTISRASAYDGERSVLISVPDQRLAVLENGTTIAAYPISTSRFGLGDHSGSYATPVGELEVAQKIGDGAPVGAVFKNRQFTGEILRPNAKGRDPIVTRILWLRGLEKGNGNAFSRNSYIHGTPVERQIGRPASFGCIRMRSRDVVQVFNMLHTGAKVAVVNVRLHQALVQRAGSARIAAQ
jgi:lipoprotein-anchoring transpeptidase ErfK/SrfK